MKKYKIAILLLTFALFLISCSGESSSEDLYDKNPDGFPKVLQENSSSSDLLEFSRYRKSGGDVVERIYQESLEKDEVLNALNDEIKELPSRQKDSLLFYETYHAIHQQYLQVSDGYIKNIRDSIKRTYLTEVFKTFKNSYQKRIDPFEKSKEKIYSKSVELNDELLILKLLISADYMDQYQKNELPSIKGLENLVSDYEVVIEKTKKAYSIQK